MHLTLTTANWDRVGFVITAKQKDYDYVEKDDVSVFIYGYPFNDFTISWISAEDVYQLYSRDELHFVNDIEGLYTIVILDKVEGKCYVITDRYGVYSLFYCEVPSHVVLADTVSEIAAQMSRVKLNHQSVIEYLHLGLRLGNKTHIEDIYEFRPSTICEINRDLQMTQRRYWTLLGRPESDRIIEEDFREAFDAHIMTAMSLEQRISLPLTGGLDTRAILSACIPSKEKLHCYTHGVKDSNDVKTAQKICQYFGVEHSFYELNEEWIENIPRKLEDNAEIFNGLIPSLWFIHVQESYKKEENEGELLITGVLGNELWRCSLGRRVARSMNLDPTNRTSANIDDLALVITNLYASIDARLGDVYGDYSTEEIRRTIREAVREELLEAEHTNDPVALSEFFSFRCFCSNWAGNSLKATGKHFKVFAAFLQRDLLREIPLMILDKKAQGHIEKYIVAKNDPYLANVLLDLEDISHGVVIGGSMGLRFRGSTLLLSRKVKMGLNMMARRILKKDIFRIPYFTDYPNWLRNYHKAFVQEVLSYDKMVVKELFKKQELEGIVNAFLSGDDSLTRFVVGLLCLEIWLRRIGNVVVAP